MRTALRVFATLFVAALGLALGVLILMRPAKAVVTASTNEGVATNLELAEFSQRSVVYDRHGDVLAVLHAEENRSPVTLDQIPPHVVNAIVDVEDENFWNHNGVNVRAMVRAAVANTSEGGIRQGGSTITQQLVKNALFTNPKRDVGRKVKEAVMAVRLEEQMTKEEILERYLNTVYFGNGAYGVQAAAETYWGVQANQLTVEQGAFLAGLIRNPVGYDPFRHPEASRNRRDFALRRMVLSGHLQQAEADALELVPLPTSKFNPIPTRDFYFVEEVKQTLLDDPRLGETPQERYNALFRGGLRIETTFDPRMQDAAEKAVKDRLPDTKGRFTAALATIEPSTGAVRAMVAGPGAEQAKYNLATGRGGSGRQAGSSFKPFVLVTALLEGVGPKDTISGSEPCKFIIEGAEPENRNYEPQNYEGTKGGVGPIEQQLWKSINCAFVRLGLSFDPDQTKSMEKVVETAKKMGIRKPLQPLVSLSLGAQEVTPLDMASGYATLANDGVYQRPYYVEKIVNRSGRVLMEGRADGEQVIPKNVARTAVQVMKGVVSQGTGTKARISGREVAGKTGTSQEWRDAWFVGFTPQLSTAVWMGSPVGQVEMKNVGGIRVTGGSYPAQIWNRFMTEALKGTTPQAFAAADYAAFGKPERVKVPNDKSTDTTVRRRRRPTTTVAPATESDSGSGSGSGPSSGAGSGSGEPTPSEG